MTDPYAALRERMDWITLRDGPMEGRTVAQIGGVRLILPEMSTCNRPSCFHSVTHEYDRNGRWIRSYSFLTSWVGRAPRFPEGSGGEFS